MKITKIIPIVAIAILTGKTNESFSAQLQDEDPPKIDEINRPHKSPKVNKAPKVSYDAVSTALNVLFPANGQGGKVEIYRYGTLVAADRAQAGAQLNFVLRNYGKGEYAVVVSSGNTAVYTGIVTVK